MIKSDQRSGVSTFEEMARRLDESGQLYTEFAKTDIAERIYSAMQREDVSKAELARRLRKSRAYITQILQGSVNFTIESLVRIATVLDCELDMRLTPKSMASHWNLQSQNSGNTMKNSDDYVKGSGEKPTANTNELALAA